MGQKLTVTTVAPVQVLLAVTCKVAHLVALVALLAASATASELTAFAATTGSAGTATTAAAANVLAVAGVMARPVTLEARISRHFLKVALNCLLSAAKFRRRRRLLRLWRSYGSCLLLLLLPAPHNSSLSPLLLTTLLPTPLSF